LFLAIVAGPAVLFTGIDPVMVTLVVRQEISVTYSWSG
jgi:hypothetical protein